MSDDSAFPEFQPNYQSEADFPNLEPVGGLTKRETFAALAMHGILSAGGYDPESGATYFIPEDITSRKSVLYADALIAELSKAEAT